MSDDPRLTAIPRYAPCLTQYVDGSSPSADMVAVDDGGFYRVADVEHRLASHARSVEGLEKEIYIGDHHFPDLTWKHRCEELRAALSAKDQQEQQLRGQLWMNHQCSIGGLYGDDGELQCNATHQNGEDHFIGPLDFKRQAVLQLTSAICSMLRFESRARIQAEAESAAKDQQLDKEREAWKTIKAGLLDNTHAAEQDCQKADTALAEARQQLAALRAERDKALVQAEDARMGHVRLDETRAKAVSGTLYERISWTIELLTKEVRESQLYAQANEAECRKLIAEAEAAKARREAAIYKDAVETQQLKAELAEARARLAGPPQDQERKE